jgi:hypothetical protein
MTGSVAVKLSAPVERPRPQRDVHAVHELVDGDGTAVIAIADARRGTLAGNGKRRRGQRHGTNAEHEREPQHVHAANVGRFATWRMRERSRRSRARGEAARPLWISGAPRTAAT